MKRPLNRIPGDIGNRFPGDLDRQALRLEPVSLAGGTGIHPHVLFDFAPDIARIGLLVAALQVRNHPFERPVVKLAATVFVVIKPDRLRAGAVEEKLLMLRGQLSKRGPKVEAEMGRQRFEHLVVEHRASALPGADRPLAQGELFVRNHQVGIDVEGRPKTVACRTGAMRGVERKNTGLHLRITDAAIDAGQVLRKKDLFFLFKNNDDPLPHFRRQFQRVGQPPLEPFFDHQAIDHHFDGVLLVLLLDRRLLLLGKIDHLAVDPDPNESFLTDRKELFFILPLPALDDRRQNLNLLPLWEMEDGVDHLLDRLRRDLFAALITERPADPGKKKAEIIVDFSDGSDGRAGVLAGGFLLDGDGRGEPFDRVDVGLVHLLQKLPRVGRERLHIASLPFRVDRVERQRRLPRPGEPRNHHKLVPRNLQIDVL